MYISMNATRKIGRWLHDEALPRLRPGDRLDATVSREQDLDAECDDRDVLTVVCVLVRGDLALCCCQVTARTETEAARIVAAVRGAR